METIDKVHHHGELASKFMEAARDTEITAGDIINFHLQLALINAVLHLAETIQKIDDNSPANRL